MEFYIRRIHMLILLGQSDNPMSQVYVLHAVDVGSSPTTSGSHEYCKKKIPNFKMGVIWTFQGMTQTATMRIKFKNLRAGQIEKR